MHPLRQLTEADLRRRTSLKWSAFPDDVLPLWVAEMDALLAEPIQRALEGVLARGDLGYPLTGDYLEAFAGFAEERWDWTPTVAREAADVMTAVRTAIELAGAPGDAVVVNPPVYPPFFEAVAWAGRRLEHAPLTAAGRIDLDALEAAFAAAGPGSVYLLCNPHNPTATVPTRAELEVVAGLAAERGVRIVVDEIHAPLVPQGFVPFLSVAGSETAFVATSASKSFNLAGVKAALLLAGGDAEPDLLRLPDLAEHGASHLGRVAHIAAFREGGPWLDALIADLDDNRRLLRALLDEHLPEVRWNGERGCYLAWLEFPASLGDDPAAVLVEKARVALSAGPGFGPGGRRHARLNYATTPQILRQAVERIATAL